MNDYHLDPPEYDEPPEWWMNLEDAMADEQMPRRIKETIAAALAAWAQEINAQPEEIQDDYLEDLPPDYYPGPENCPHGRQWTDCDACDHASDIAFDAARENLIR